MQLFTIGSATKPIFVLLISIKLRAFSRSVKRIHFILYPHPMNKMVVVVLMDDLVVATDDP